MKRNFDRALSELGCILEQSALFMNNIWLQFTPQNCPWSSAIMITKQFQISFVVSTHKAVTHNDLMKEHLHYFVSGIHRSLLDSSHKGSIISGDSKRYDARMTALWWLISDHRESILYPASDLNKSSLKLNGIDKSSKRDFWNGRKCFC